MDTYTNIQLLSGKEADAFVVPVQLDSVFLQSSEGTQTEMFGGEDLRPRLLSSALCANVVLKVVYVIKYNSRGQLLHAAVSLVLGFLREAQVWLQQEFQLMFVQDGGELAVRYSGRPGYLVGSPLVSGTKTPTGISRSTTLGDSLSQLHGAGDQDCLRGPHLRSPVLFNLDSVSGCTLRMEDIANCSLTAQLLLDVLRGPNYPDYVASFGNSALEQPQDWLQVQRSPSVLDLSGCSIPLAVHLEVRWTRFGTLLNPQAQIVAVREVVQTNSSAVDLLSGGTGLLPIRTSVAFTPTSAGALPGYRTAPTISARLPSDFFFPFV